ncbi:MAG: hypothetical protein AUH85_04120 [Chloroflexi bacterium 13_1_40CM_4_68_4]|nr:MAG: hypothetical protein AUH85_04120 [Chloroflexi bacterium 13_1_40CM_4_68_4]
MGYRRHGGRWRGERPPWWPEGETWPPRRYGPPPWIRRRFFFAFALLALVVVMTLVAGAIAIAQIFGAAAAIVLSAVVLAVLVAFRSVAPPVGDVLDAVERVAAGDYDARIRARGPGRMRQLAHAFNTMVERLASNESQRRQLLADVTHELRTPLTVIQGQLEGLIDGVYPRDDAHLEPILEETRVMARVIDDLRTLSLAESGALALHRESSDVRVLIEDAVAPFRAHADTEGVALVVDAAPSLPQLDIDPVRIRQVLGNLITNALRYTPRGGRVEVQARGRDDRVSITVSDTGAGIAPDVLTHVFERFYRSADSTGSGLGLPIARSLVVAHGGDIAAASDGPGHGTTISVTLPIGASPMS